MRVCCMQQHCAAAKYMLKQKCLAQHQTDKCSKPSTAQAKQVQQSKAQHRLGAVQCNAALSKASHSTHPAMQARLGALKREEEWLHREQERLESEKVQHIR